MHTYIHTQAGGVRPLIEMVRKNDPDTRGFAASCLLCLCKDKEAVAIILREGGSEPLLSLAHGPPTWLRAQAIEMLTQLGVAVPDPDEIQLNFLLGVPMSDVAPTDDSADDFAPSMAPQGGGLRAGVGGSAGPNAADGSGISPAMHPPSAGRASAGRASSAEGGNRPNGKLASSRGGSGRPSAKASARKAGGAKGEAVVARTKLKIRATPELSSVDLGDLAAGSQVRAHLLES